MKTIALINHNSRAFAGRWAGFLAVICACIIMPAENIGAPADEGSTGGGKPNPSWESLAAEWKCPAWFQDAKFGLWLHWGPQSVHDLGGGWYARHMYIEPGKLGSEQWGKNAWEFHRKTYGHQSEFGYKELCRDWKAEKFDAETTMREFTQWGAHYVAIMGNHHDNFDLFNRLYIFVFGVTAPRQVDIPMLATGEFKGRIQKVKLIGEKEAPQWSRGNSGLKITLPGIAQAPHCAVIAVDADGL
jgi:hypothetical protein